MSTSFSNSMRLTAVLLLAGSFLAAPAAAQTVRGVLVDEHTGEPVALGVVKLYAENHDSLAATLTDDRGFFELEAPDEGIYLLNVERFGYWSALVGPFELEEGVARVVEARVAARPVELEGVIVDAEARLRGLTAVGFYERMERGRGDFITPQEIASSGAVYVQQLFYGRETSTVVPVPAIAPQTARQLARRLRFRQPIQKGRAGGADDYTYRGSNLAIDALLREELQRPEFNPNRFGPWGSMVAIRRPTGGSCVPWLFVDGNRVIPNPGESLADVVPMSRVRGVEIYQAPFQGELPFRDISSCDCGVLAFWTGMAGR